MYSTDTSSRLGLLERWGRMAARNKGKVVIAWVAILVGLIALAATVGGSFASNFSIPGTESQRATDLLQARFPQQAGDSATLVFTDPQGLSNPAIQSRVQTILNQAKALPEVVGVGSPYTPGGSGALSQDGTIGFAAVQYAKRADSVAKGDINQLVNLVNRSSGSGLTVEAGGQIIEQVEQAPPGSSEAIGLVFAILILLIAFGSVIAMGLPLVTALVGLGASFAMLGLAARFLSLPSFTTEFAALIGLGVGIDYALLVVTRYREGLHHGLSVENALGKALNTAGRSVLFAGTVVVIALLGLTAVGIPFVAALGEGAAAVVAIAVAVAVTLLPAMLAYAGHSVDRWQIPMFHDSGAGSQDGVWYKFAKTTQRHPIYWFAGSLAVLLIMAVPFLHMRLGSSDAGNSPTSTHSRRAYDLLAKGFGPGFNGPLVAVVDLKGAPGDHAATLDKLRNALAAAPGVVQASPAILNQAGDAAIIQVTPSTSPQDPGTQDLIRTLRTNIVPAATAGSGAHAYIAGATAAFVDIGNRISSRMPLFFGAVIGLSCLLLLTVFRSVVIALKAAIMNLLSIGAAYGAVVAVFQWGWLSNIVGVKAGPIESFLPMMLFAILFGLSMDYEVFLISRIQEEYHRTGQNSESVANGVAVTARVITAAAAIMVMVFASFIFGGERVIKEFGLGLSVAILVDATVVRMLLVPATMELLGDSNWWLPGWLDRLLPHLDLEGEPLEREPAIAAAD